MIYLWLLSCGVSFLAGMGALLLWMVLFDGTHDEANCPICNEQP